MMRASLRKVILAPGQRLTAAPRCPAAPRLWIVSLAGYLSGDSLATSALPGSDTHRHFEPRSHGRGFFVGQTRILPSARLEPSMLLRQRTLPTGPIEPCLPTKADTLP